MRSTRRLSTPPSSLQRSTSAPSRAPILRALLPATLLLLACAPEPRAGASAAESSATQRLQALYVPMRDGVRIAIDLWLPPQALAGEKVPSLMRMTRYWRAADIVGADEDITLDSNHARAEEINGAGYAYVIVDARGTGASFGSRAYETTQDEVRDYGEVVDWITGQTWSNGRVGSFGVSYDGTTAEMLAVNQRPAVRAVAPLYPDWNAYEHLVYPGGVFLEFFTDDWGAAVWAMDNNDICTLQGAAGDDCESLRTRVRGVKPVDADGDRSLLASAVAEHATNARVAEAARAIEYRDDPFGEGGPADVARLSTPSFHTEALANSGVAYFTRVGWLDAATVNGALSRFSTLPNPQRVVIGALSHGGGYDTDPFRPKDAPPDPSVEEQQANLFAFFDQFLKEGRESPLESEVRYATLGSGEWHSTSTWPPPGFVDTPFYFAADGQLSRESPGSASGSDRYVIDYSATTGRSTRWHTQMGGGDVIYPDRRDEDRKLVTYTGAPLESALEITGHPQVTIWTRSSARDGAFFVYLEDVAPDGRVTYVTEGQLRGAVRTVAGESLPYRQFGPARTYERADARDLVPGEITELQFDLWATSVRIEAGHRFRVAIAGADAGNFARYPLDGSEPTIEVQRNASHPSRIVLPIRER